MIEPVYKLNDWVDRSKLSLKYLSANPCAINYLIENMINIDLSYMIDNPYCYKIIKHKINKLYLYDNPNLVNLFINDFNIHDIYIKHYKQILLMNSSAISLLKKLVHTFDKYDWVLLSLNINAIDILENNQDKICWCYLSANPNAIHLLEKNIDKIDWFHLSENPNAIGILEKNIDKIHWENLSINPNAIRILEKNINKINWDNLSLNPNASKILEKYPKLINWKNLSRNPGAIDLLKKYPYFIDWKELLENKNGHLILKDIFDVIDDNDWCILSKNPCIFTLDYNRMSENIKPFKDELINAVVNKTYIRKRENNDIKNIKEICKKYGLVVIDNKKIMDLSSQLLKYKTYFLYIIHTILFLIFLICLCIIF